MSASMKILGNFVNFVKTLVLIELLSYSFCVLSHTVEEHLLCRRCGLEIADLHNVINVPSTHALSHKNETFYKESEPTLIQRFRNPQGAEFDVITTSQADVEASSVKFSEETWFSGYKWRIIQCTRCGQHLGWLYESELPSQVIKSFYGLIRDNLLRENYKIKNLDVTDRFPQSGIAGPWHCWSLPLLVLAIEVLHY